MQIIKFCARWCSKCKLFKDVECDTVVDIDLPSNQRTVIKYQISIVPTFIALGDTGKIKGKLTNPTSIDEFLKWKDKVSK